MIRIRTITLTILFQILLVIYNVYKQAVVNIASKAVIM